MNAAQVYHRARSLQRAIAARGGPPPSLRDGYAKACRTLDYVQTRIESGLGWVWIPVAMLIAALGYLGFVYTKAAGDAAPAITAAVTGTVDAIGTATRWTLGLSVTAYAVWLFSRRRGRARASREPSGRELLE